eukprot:XP_001701857.1 flagellar associated protein [Chlamydomonas reinhardtii]
MAQQLTMTNMGPRRKGSARLEPLAYGGSSGGRASPSTGDFMGEVPMVPDGRSPSAHLPPLNRVRDTAGEAFDGVVADDVSPGVSPARRARKAALMTRGDLDHRSVLQASLALDQKEREMALIRDNKREYGRILLELWVNQVLDSQSTANNPLGASQSMGDPLKMDASALKGLASYGLTRVELLGAGLSNEGIDRLYRCMYVYTVGFFDVMQDILSHNDFKTEILSNVWKGFLTIAESALQVSFRSDYLKLYQSQQARQDSVNTEKAVAWLTNAHAEERAARQALKGQLQELQGVLERERQAHNAAVSKYVAEVEERVRLQAQLEDATGQLSSAAMAQVDLILQRDGLTQQLAEAEGRAGALVEHVRGVYEALAMDTALRLYQNWRDQTELAAGNARQLYAARDGLRSAKLKEHELQTELDRTCNAAAALQRSLTRSEEDAAAAHVTAQRLEAELEALKELKADADRQIARLTDSLATTSDSLQRTQVERNTLADATGLLQSDVEARDQTIGRLQARLAAEGETLAEISRSMDIARGFYKQRFQEASKRAGDLQWSIFRAERQIRTLEGKIEHKNGELSTLAAATEQAKVASDLAQQTLAGALLDIENKKALIASLERALGAAQEESTKLRQDLSETLQRAEEAERELEEAHEEIQRQVEAMEALEGRIAAAGEERGRLLKQIERLVGEKAEVEKMAKQQRETMQTEINKRGSEIASLRAEVEGVNLKMEALKSDMGQAGALLERKREKKKKWKVQRQWDELSRTALELQSKLEAQQRAVEAARREYETARAAFYEAPTEEGRKNVLLGIEAVLAKLRVERKDTELELAALRERQADLRGALQAHENATFKRRIAVVARRTGKTEFTLQHELSRRLDESKERESKLAGTLESQALAATTAQTRSAKLESDFVRTEAELRDLADKLKKTLEFKVELERQLAQYKNMVGFLQAEVSSLSRERDALKANLQDVDQRTERLTNDVAEAQAAVGTTAKRLEAKYEAEKREAVAAAVEKQRHLEAQLSHSHARIKELEALTGSATASLRRYLAASLDRMERALPPRFIWHLTPGAGQVVVAGAAAAVSGLPSLVLAMEGVAFDTNFDYQTDTVLRWLASSWSFDVTLVTISQLYVEKLQADIRAEEGLLGGVAGPRQPLEAAMYDFFTSRYGCRQAAELHLAAFLGAVRRFRSQHPKAAEGFSLVKAKVLTRLAREFLRGSFATTRDDVAATPDYVRHMALNDEEKSIDLELALEAILRAFVAQYREDSESLCAMFRANFENMGRKLVTPDDLSMFLRTLNPEKAAALAPGRILSLYVEAARAAGPASADLGRHLCRVVLESGFVGISTHVSRHEPMRALPPYDEFELLEESWRLMRVAVEQQVAVGKSHPEKVKADLPSYVDLARRVDELVVEEIMPFDPPTGDIGRTKKTSAAGGVPGQAGAEGEDGEDEASPSRDVSPTGRRTMRSTLGHKSMGAALSRSASSRSLGGDGAAASMYDLSGAGAAAAAAAQRKGGKLLAPKGGVPTEPNSPMPGRKPAGTGGGDDPAQELLNASVVKLKFDSTGGK